MAYALTIGDLIVTNGGIDVSERCECEQVRDLCMPSFVFSVPGQVGFRRALHHLSTCGDATCKSLKKDLANSMRDKLNWLLKEGCLLGCIHVQAGLYGSKDVLLRSKEFPHLANHLASCPKESCAQLRRAILLTIRDNLRREQQGLAD